MVSMTGVSDRSGSPRVTSGREGVSRPSTCACANGRTCFIPTLEESPGRLDDRQLVRFGSIQCLHVRNGYNGCMIKPIALHILLGLADRDSHGYALMQAIREQSGGQVPVQTASFYRHLGKLMDEGLVAEAAGRPADDDTRRGAYYRLTPRGRQTLAAEKQRLTDLVAQLKRVRTSPRKAGA